ncbi:DNA cytosine methyltransferase [Haematospirillum jordaniae]|uniref:DNA cytosine methyltransferase n=1 Tax=Haematospirillum jordaniae TaxID=1549855 RepID=UPI000AD81D9A|nr:DNA cytosine methyltransferase [Haematospirillum jordaniae]
MQLQKKMPKALKGGKREARLKVVDLFAGAGGLSCGLEMAGFETQFVCEIVRKRIVVRTISQTSLKNSAARQCAGLRFSGRINELAMITEDVVDAAGQALVIGNAK